MAAPKRNKAKRALDLRETLDLYANGWPQHRIAAKLGVTQQQVSKDLSAALELVGDETKEAAEKLRAALWARHDLVQRLALAGYQRSCRPKKSRSTETTSGEDKEGNATATTKKGNKSEGQAGNPQYLGVFAKSLDSQAKLMALNLQPDDDQGGAEKPKQITTMVIEKEKIVYRDRPADVPALEDKGAQPQ